MDDKKKKNTLIGCGTILGLCVIIAIAIGTCLGGGDSDNEAVKSDFSQEAVTESSVKSALQHLSGTSVVSGKEITAVEVSPHMGTSNSNDYIVHVYFEPESIWDEEHAIEIAVHTSIHAMEILFANSSVAEVVMWEQIPFTDKYGNSEVETATRIVMDKSIADKIVDWEKVDERAFGDYTTFFQLAELQYIHPAIAKEL